MTRTWVVAAMLVVGVALAGCSSGSDSSSQATAPAMSSAPAEMAADGGAPGSAPAAAIPANVPGTYSNGDWVVRLAADGTWEEDLNGQSNAYGGSYTVQGESVLLRDRGGSTETATLQGDELKLPSITLRRQ